MQKFFKEKYDEEQLKTIKKMDKLLSDSHEEFINKKNENENEDKMKEEKEKEKAKLKELLFEELYNKLDDMFNLSSLFDKERIMNIIERNDGNEADIIKEIELMF